MTETADAQPTPEVEQTGAPKEVEKGGVKVKLNPLARSTYGGIVIPGVGHFRGGERISKEQFNKLEKDATGRYVGSLERYPLLVKDEEE